VPDSLLGPIVAIGGGALLDPTRTLARYLVELTGKPMPVACYIGAANGDSETGILLWYRAMSGLARPTDLPLFTRPDHIDGIVEEADIIFVAGGNTVNLLAIWRLHGVDRLLRDAHRRGAVLAGSSAGSLCWFESGVTDSFGPSLGPFEGGLGLVPGSNCPHYDAEPRRRPVYQHLVMSGTLPNGYAADDGAALVFDGPDLREVVSWRAGATGYRVERTSDGAVIEEALVARTIG
jgi:dipeptidase E